MTERNLVWIKSLGHSVRFHVLSTGTSEGKNVDGEGGGGEIIESFASIRGKNWGVPMGWFPGTLGTPWIAGTPGIFGTLRPRDLLDPWTPETPSSSGPEMGVVASFCVSN